MFSMASMFRRASNFNQSLTNWCIYLEVEPSFFATESPLANNTAYKPLWNGIGCTYKCYNGGIRNISDTDSYSCICVGDFIGLYCEKGVNTTLTSTITSTLTSTITSTLTSTITSTSTTTLTLTLSSTLTTTQTSIKEDSSSNGNNLFLIIGLVSGGVFLVGLFFFVRYLYSSRSNPKGHRMVTYSVKA